MSTRTKGFTLVEILVVMGIFGLLASVGMFLSFDFYRTFSFHSEQNKLVSVLEKARGEAINNICIGSTCTEGKAHGVHIGSDKYTIFQTESDWASRETGVDEDIEAGGGAFQVTGLTEVVFDPLSVHTTDTGTITLTADTGQTSNITINSEGQIDW
ncbi:MAG: GspH/FimT family pseudopilin [Candidatus Paceibacterota bacterium]